jgi:plastocyanin
LDKDLFYISLVFILIGVGGQLSWYFFGVVPNTQASFQEMQNVSGLMMLVGFLILPAGLFKDGLPAPGFGAKIFIGIIMILLVGVGFTGYLLLPQASGPQVKAQTFITIPLGAQSGGLAAYYLPVTVTVVIGVNNTVQWTNNDTTLHTVTSVTSGVFGSPAISPGQTYIYTFTTAGTFNYYCTFHNFMKGVVIVKSG